MKKNTQSSTFYGLFMAIMLLASTRATAQTKQKWFRTEFGIAQSAVYDNGHSLVKYKGTGLQLHVGNDAERAKSYTQFDNQLIWTPLSAQVSDDKYASSTQQGNYRMSYTYLRKLSKTQDKTVKIAVGGSLSGDFNMRFYPIQNNAFSWDFNLGLNVAARAQHDFTFKKRSFSISYQLGLPLLTYNHRPNYLGYFPIGEIFEGKSGTSADWQSLGRVVAGVNSKYFYMTQQITLDKINPNGNRIRLAYNWQYANNGFATHKYQNILSGFSLGILTNLSKKSKDSN